uniref:G_PROTEIN_RECEP_F1_2 domain-containing protein n=1 Tax=Steinernema glaseri TaxID=37863 RepID=A0A1I7YRM7_9BILA
MATQDTILNTFSNIFTNYGPSVFNGLIIVSTISGQSLIRKLTFSCPCAYPLNLVHSTAFIFGPAIALLIFGITINQNTWKLVHGCCFRSTSTRHQWKTIIVYWISIISQALIAPIAWLFVAFLDGGYYQCLRAADYCPLTTSPQCQNATAMALDPIYNSLSKTGTICAPCICSMNDAHAKILQSESQVIAWMLLIFVGVSAMTVICFIRMFDKYTYVQNTYVGTYRAEERRIFENEAKEHARVVAEQNCKRFFEQGKWSKSDWDSVSSVPYVANAYIWDRHLKVDVDPHLYTPLQVWTNQQGCTVTPTTYVPPQAEQSV